MWIHEIIQSASSSRRRAKSRGSLRGVRGEKLGFDSAPDAVVSSRAEIGHDRKLRFAFAIEMNGVRDARLQLSASLQNNSPQYEDPCSHRSGERKPREWPHQLLRIPLFCNCSDVRHAAVRKSAANLPLGDFFNQKISTSNRSTHHRCTSPRCASRDAERTLLMSDEVQIERPRSAGEQDGGVSHRDPSSGLQATPAEDHEGDAGGDASNGAPHFVAPSSYLRPLSRAQASIGDANGSRPSTRDSKPMPPSPLDREQIEGLVSFYYCVMRPRRKLSLLARKSHFDAYTPFEGLDMWLTNYLACGSVLFEPFSRSAQVTTSCH